MVPLFSTFQDIERGSRIDPKLNQLMQKQKSNLSQCVRYYQQNYVPVDMTHPLVRLCYRFNWDLTQQSFDYYNRANEQKEELCSPLGITTSFNKGEIHEGIFYGEACKTALVLEVRDTNMRALMDGRPWASLTPLRVLTRPGVRGAYLRPDLINEDEEGYAVVAIDVPLLAGMFKRWRLDNQKKPKEARERPEHFVGRYLLPSMMHTQMDAVLLNSLNAFSLRKSELKDLSGVALGLIDQTANLAEELFDHVNALQGSTWEQVANHIPSFEGETLADHLPVLSDRISQANEWASVGGSVALCRVCSKYATDNPEGDRLVNLWMQEDRHYKNDRTFSKTPDPKFGTLLENHYNDFLLEFLD